MKKKLFFLEENPVKKIKKKFSLMTLKKNICIFAQYFNYIIMDWYMGCDKYINVQSKKFLFENCYIFQYYTFFIHLFKETKNINLKNINLKNKKMIIIY